MVCPNNVRLRQQLETLYQRSPTIPFHQQFWAFLQQIGEAIVYELTCDRREPQISKYYDIEGQALWCIYEPRSRSRVVLSSESDVLAWLEDHHAD